MTYTLISPAVRKDCGAFFLQKNKLNVIIVIKTKDKSLTCALIAQKHGDEGLDTGRRMTLDP